MSDNNQSRPHRGPGDSNANALAHQFLENLQQENEELAKIKELLARKEELKRDIQNSIDKEADLVGFSQGLEYDINQLRIIKTSLLQKKELQQDIDRLREEGNNGPPSPTIQSSAVAAMPESVFESNAVSVSVAAAASATVVRGEHDGEAMAQIESDALIAKTMQEEWDNVNGENCVGRVGGENSIVDDRKPSSNPASDTATSDTEGNNTPSNNTSPEGEKDVEVVEGDNNNPSNAKSGVGYENGMDSDDDSRFSGGDDEPVEDEVPDSKAIDRAAEQFELGRDVIDEEMITYDKASFELCCFRCLCGNEDHDSQITEILPSLSRRSSSPYYVRVHRSCCTTLRRFIDKEHTNAVTDYGIAVTTPPINKKRPVFKADQTFLSKAKDNADRLRTKILNDSSCKDPVQVRRTDERYNKNCRDFQAAKRKANAGERKAANVLSLFSGIGAGILVLKRLKIAINHCIVVEHDPIAEAVCSGNHKADVVKYVWITTFEELEERLDEIMEEYGPLHIVEGGPPCVEYSAVNANRTGVDSVKGQYMPKFAQLIKRIKNHKLQKGENVFFLCENVTLKWKDMPFEPIFGISPIEIDAQRISPAKRDRGYFTNLPVNELPGTDSEIALSTVTLADGWMHPAQLYCRIRNEPKPYCKSNTFMASEGRINDKRMIKVRLRDASNKNSIETSHYSVADREALMGFPVGYVERFVEPVFEKVCASFHSEDWLINAVENDWDIEELGVFSTCHYKFVCTGKDPMVSVKFGTVEKNKNDKTLYYYDCEGYCKRLLGNSYSIPVVEHLLRPVKDLFLQQEYDDAVYSFPWE